MKSMKLKNRKKKLTKNKTNIWFSTIWNNKIFCDNIYTIKIDIAEAEMDQSNLLENITEFINKSRLRTKAGND